MSRSVRRQIRKAIQEDARDHDLEPPLTFWMICYELADGRSIRLAGDVLDRRMTQDARMAFLERRLAEYEEAS